MILLISFLMSPWNILEWKLLINLCYAKGSLRMTIGFDCASVVETSGQIWWKATRSLCLFHLFTLYTVPGSWSPSVWYSKGFQLFHTSHNDGRSCLYTLLLVVGSQPMKRVIAGASTAIRKCHISEIIES